MADDERAVATVSLKEAASLVGVSERWIQMRAKEGFFSASSRGRYPLVPLVRGVRAYYDALLEKANKSAAASRATDARTREIELRIAERQGKLLPVEDCEAVVSELAALVLREFGGMAAKVTRDLDMRQKIDEEVDSALGRIRAHAEERSEALLSGRLDLDEEQEADAG